MTINLPTTAEELQALLDKAAAEALQPVNEQLAVFTELGDATTIRATLAALAELGDIETIKSTLDANRTDEQKRIDDAKAAGRREAESGIAQKLTKAKTSTVEAAIRQAATEAGFEHPDDVVNLLKSDPKIKVDDDLKVTGVAAQITELKTKRPSWIKADFNGSPPIPPARPGGGNNRQQDDEQLVVQHRNRIGAIG